MATVLDSFNRANGSLGTADNGATWSVLTGTAAISSNTAVPTGGSPSATAVIPYGNHDIADFSLKIKVTTGANPAGLIFRCLDNNNRAGCFLGITTNTASIFKTDGGTTTELTNVSFTVTTGTTYTVRAVLTGPVIDMYVDGVFKVSFTLTGGDETQYTAANGYTNIGFRGDTLAVFDDLTDNTTKGVPGPRIPRALRTALAR